MTIEFIAFIFILSLLYLFGKSTRKVDELQRKISVLRGTIERVETEMIIVKAEFDVIKKDYEAVKKFIDDDADSGNWWKNKDV